MPSTNFIFSFVFFSLTDPAGPTKTFSSFSLQFDPHHRPNSRNSQHRISSHPVENGEIAMAAGYAPSTLPPAPETHSLIKSKILSSSFQNFSA